MAGNVAEWTYFTAEDQSTGATVPYGTSSFILGGSFKSKKPSTQLAGSVGSLASEGVWADDLGFRVVFDTNRGNSIAITKTSIARKQNKIRSFKTKNRHFKKSVFLYVILTLPKRLFSKNHGPQKRPKSSISI